MIRRSVDVAILGAGFGGSLTALVLSRIGLNVLLIERGVHPRFAIGESSTPLANLVLEQLARRYDLPRLLPLCSYGAWQRAYPHLRCGLKRGFSYFQHQSGQPFVSRLDHANELLVTASAAAEDADTHWLRADFDHFLVEECVAAGISYLDQTEVQSVEQGDAWTLRGRRLDEDCTFDARFIVDASGEGGVMARELGISRDPASLATNSRTIFSHFEGLHHWRDLLIAGGGDVASHPFRCDDAALHHVFEGGWFWVLPFQDGLVSVGVTLDNARSPLDPAVSAQAEWEQTLERFPSIRQQLAPARFAQSPGGLRRSGRLQRHAATCAGANWAMLPGTACFFDPLHSTGNAHTLFGIERLAAAVERSWGKPGMLEETREYDRVLQSEVRLLDRIIHGSYACFGLFEAFTEFTMLYFAAAHSSETERRANPQAAHGAFLRADDSVYRESVEVIYRRLLDLVSEQHPAGSRQIAAFRQLVAERIAPYNLCGLCEPAKNNCYPWTG